MIETSSRSGQLAVCTKYLTSKGQTCRVVSCLVFGLPGIGYLMDECHFVWHASPAVDG